MSMCRVFSCVVGRECLLWPVCSPGKTLLAFALLHSVFQGQICLLLQMFLDFLLLHSSPLSWKGHLFWVLVLKGLVSLHRTIQLQLLQHYWLRHRLGLPWYSMVCTGNEHRSFCHFWDCIQVRHFGLFCWPVLGVHWKDWCWSWNSNTLANSCEELTHWKRLWCWEGLRAGEEGDDRGWDGWMASPTQWTSVWVNSELVMDREAWRAAIHGVTESDMTSDLTEWNWRENFHVSSAMFSICKSNFYHFFLIIILVITLKRVILIKLCPLPITLHLSQYQILQGKYIVTVISCSVAYDSFWPHGL